MFCLGDRVMRVGESGWKFSLAVLLPVIVAVALTVALAAGFIVWSAGRSDDRSLTRQQAMAAKMTATAKQDFATTQTDEVLRWDDVEVFLKGEPAAAAIDNYFGEDEYRTYGHERVYVLDANLNPVYAARAGQKADPKTYDADRAAVDPLAVRLRAPDLQAQIASYENGNIEFPPQLTDFVAIDGRVALASVLPIVSNFDDQMQRPGHYFYHVAIEFVGKDLAADLMNQYLLEGVHFDTDAATAPNETMIPIANQDGRFVAYFKWQPDRPGQALLHETLPASLGLLGVVGLVIALLLYFLARSTRALEKARAEALHRATHDPLTGLANRALFNERLERSPLPLTLLALDLDKFKAVNDTLGHEAGDELLQQVASRLIPLVGDSGLVARLGGDEFMILLWGDLDTAHIETLAAKIVESLGEPFFLGRDVANIGVSVGIATAITDERKELVSRADFALYDAKESGRNTFKVFDAIKKAA